VKTQLIGTVTMLDVERNVVLIRSPSHEDRIEAIFPAKLACFFIRAVNQFVCLHGSWLEDGSFNVVRCV